MICSLNKSNAEDDYGFKTKFCPIMQLVNLSIRHSVVPTNWKVNTVNPIFKSVSKSKKQL